MKRFSILVILFAVTASAISLLAVSPTALAQRPTPTNIVSPTPTKSVESNKSTSEKSSFVPPQEGAVWGYVIDYSNSGAPQAGVPVVLDGGGWSAETVSDSNGFYKFSGLGSGEARLRLKLPPEAHPVNQDWRIHTGSAGTQATNLGFYWGENPPLPVVMTVDTEKSSVTVAVKNQSGGDAHNLLVTVSLPSALNAAKISAPDGAETEIADHSATALLKMLPNGEKATFTIETTADTPPDAAVTADVSLVYDEQLTPQQMSVAVQPGKAGSGAVGTEAVIPETGGAGETNLPATAAPIAVLAALFVLGLAYAGIRGFARHV